MASTSNAPRIIPLEEGWDNEIKAKVRFVLCCAFSTENRHAVLETDNNREEWL
jgi:hypothetical protein